MSSGNPRHMAYDILLRIEKERSYADILIDRAISSGELTGPDRGLLTELVYGVLRHRGTLDHIANQFSRLKIEKLERSVLLLLRLGLYQVLFLDRIPVSAAVNETVKMAKSLAPRASGLVNAVLRRADRERGEIRYPDRQAEPLAFLAARHSQPPWIIGQWIGQLGFDEAESLARAMSEPPPLSLRVNTLKISHDELRNRLAAAGIATAPAMFSPDGLYVTSRVPLAALPEFREGLCTIQDESSQLAALFLAPRPGETILDICSAPGGKATHLAQIMENRGEILACDSSPRKLRLIEENAGRLGITIVSTAAIDGTIPLTQASSPQIGGKSFDRILVDAPCSGMGVLRRNPDGKWWKTPSDIKELVLLQKLIIGNAAHLLKAGGTLVYATCSTTVEENEEVIDDFLSKQPEFVLEDLRSLFPDFAGIFTEAGCFRSWPHRHGMDGFFAARLRKTT